MTATAKVFKSGNSQAVRLPKKFRINNDEVLIKKEGDRLIIIPKPKSWYDFFYNIPNVTEDFMIDREDSLPQERTDMDK
jgi:antitoxin VapB